MARVVKKTRRGREPSNGDRLFIFAAEAQPLLRMAALVSSSPARVAAALALADGPASATAVQAAVAPAGDAGARALADMRDRRLVEKRMLGGRLSYAPAPSLASLGRALRDWMLAASVGAAMTPPEEPRVARALAHQKLGRFDRHHQVLAAIAANPGITVPELMKRLCIDKRTLKRALKRLETAGVIQYTMRDDASHAHCWKLTGAEK